jgi:hypothetical protein
VIKQKILKVNSRQFLVISIGFTMDFCWVFEWVEPVQ